MLEHNEKREIIFIDMVCSKESKKEEKRTEKIRKNQQMCFGLRER